LKRTKSPTKGGRPAVYRESIGFYTTINHPEAFYSFETSLFILVTSTVYRESVGFYTTINHPEAFYSFETYFFILVTSTALYCTVCTITGHLIIITVSAKGDPPAPRRQIILLCRLLGFRSLEDDGNCASPTTVPRLLHNLTLAEFGIIVTKDQASSENFQKNQRPSNYFQRNLTQSDTTSQLCSGGTPKASSTILITTISSVSCN
jgi:hypothetical protein